MLGRRALWATMIVLAIVGGVAIWGTWRSTPTAANPDQNGWVSTPYGPLGPADRDMVIRVRLACLWEAAVGEEMSQKASDPKVAAIGAKIALEHHDLNKITLAAATKLGVIVPDQPSAEQQAWLDQLTAATGSNYDYLAVNILRQAHGQVLPLVTSVRSGTRNSVVRDLGDQTAVFVTHHMQYLESTGLVDYDRLDLPPSPPRAVVTRGGQYENIPVALIVITVLIIVGAVIALFVRLLASRRKPVVPGIPRTREGP